MSNCGTPDSNFDPTTDGVIVQDDGVDVVNPATTLNFTGAGVTVTDAGGGVANIDIPGGGSGTTQVFEYAADGTETDTFTVALPAARADALYQVQVQLAGPAGNALKLIKVLNATRTVNGFDIQLSAAAENLDVFYFTVEDPT